MTDGDLSLTPGPVALTERVREAMDRPVASRRSTDVDAIHERALAGLDYVFTRSTLDETQTAADGTSLVLPGPAATGLEAAVASLVGPDDEVVVPMNGAAGRRLARIAERHATCERVEVDWGESLDLDAVDAAITAETDLVAMVHNEPSTGLLNPVGAVGEIARANDARFVVDGATAIGASEFRVDDWGVDVAVTDAGTALAAPPGLDAVYLTDRAAEAVDGANAPYTLDLDRYLEATGDARISSRSAVSLVAALAEAVEQVVEEGMPHRIRRHRRQSRAFGDGFTAMGLSRFSDIDGPTEPSNTVTAIELPASVRPDSDAFFDAVAERGVTIAGGQAHLDGEVFRVSNMGNLSDEEILRGVEAVGEALREVGVKVSVDSGVDTARDVLNGE